MTYPTFTNGTVLPASDLNAIGLWLVKSQTVGSGVSSVTVTGAFSADYEAYRIVWSGGIASTGILLGLQLGSTTSNYYGASAYSVFGSTTPYGYSDNNAARFTAIGGGDGSCVQLSAEVVNPFLTKATVISGPWQNSTAGGHYSGRLADATSYTAFTLIPNTGTLTGGTISVYGYRKA
jgi:hypothetical protein